MSKAGKKTTRGSKVTRVPTNLTIDIDLKGWAADFVEEDGSPYKGSVANLVNELMALKKAEVEKKVIELGKKQGDSDAKNNR